MTKSGILYLVATPIGNLEEITIRALNTLKSVNYIYAEDTRQSIKLLSSYQISTPLRSLYNKGMIVKVDEIISLLNNGNNIAIISDAGVPIISDPGYEVLAKLPSDIMISPIGCPNAAISALISSRLPASPFLFLGFLTRKKEQAILSEYLNFKGAIIIYESPLRVINTLDIISKVFNNPKVCIAREISKVHEEFITDWVDNILLNKVQIQGECVIIIYNEIKDQAIDINQLITDYLKKGYANKEIIKLIKMQTKASHSEIYDLIIKRSNHEK